MTAAVVQVAKGHLRAHPTVHAPTGWQWGPLIEDGCWLVATRGRVRWAIRIVLSDEEPKDDPRAFADRLDQTVWELTHPDIVALLMEADASTTSRLAGTPRQQVPETIAADIVELNEEARKRLRG